MGKRPNSIILATLLFYFYNGLIPTAYGYSLAFGPEFFPDDRDSSVRIVRSFSIEDDSRKFLLSIQSEENSEESTGRSIVEINGEIVASLDSGRQFKMLIKPVKLQKENDLSIDVTGGASASLVVTIMGMEEYEVASLVPPTGKEINLVEHASIVFPAGTFDSAQHVKIYTSASAETNDIFEAYATGPRLPYEIRINTGNRAPEEDLQVDLNIPDSFYSSPYQIHIFALMHDNPDAPEEHDRFFMISSSVDEVIHTVRTTLPKHAFSTRPGKDGTYEAIITVGLLY